MKRTLTRVLICIVCSLPAFKANADVTFTVDPSAAWLGYMNVFELDGTTFVYGEPWGTADLTANFVGSTLVLGPNSIGDPNEFWYQDTSGTGNTSPGGPGAPGNKTMDANFYVENAAGALAGETVTFEGTVLTNTLSGPHAARVFIRDFAPDYSSFNEATVPLTPGAFSISLLTDSGAGRHVQYGFNMNGPNVWITDVAPFGTVTIATASAGTPGDFNNDGDVDGQDFLVWQRGGSPTPLSAADLATWQGAYGNPLAAVSAVPEPASIAILIAMSGLLAVKRGRNRD